MRVKNKSDFSLQWSGEPKEVTQHGAAHVENILWSRRNDSSSVSDSGIVLSAILLADSSYFRGHSLEGLNFSSGASAV